MPVPVRRLVPVLVALAALLALALPALPAHADPTLFIDGGNGTRTVRVHHPDHPEWFINVKVETVFGFVPGGDAGPEFASAYAELADGPGVLRWQTNNPRLRVDQDGVTADTVVNDYFPAPVANPRDNTPDGPIEPDAVDNPAVAGAEGDACTLKPDRTFDGRYKLPLGVSGSLYDERAPKDGECEGASQVVPNPLNSASDFSPDATVTRARGDWIDIGLGVATSGVTAVRVFFLVRFINGDLIPFSVGSNFAPYGV